MAVPLAAPDRAAEGGAPAITQEAWAGFRSQLRSYVGRRVDSGAVDDVVGDILLRLVQTQGTLATARNPTAWIVRVAANAVSDHHRRRAVERRVHAQAGLDEVAVSKPPDREAEAEIIRCLIPFIQGLPEPYRQALELTDIEGLAHAVAGRRLGLTVSGIKARVRRGRAKLRQALHRCCAIELDQRGRVVDVRHRGPKCGCGGA